jgi:CheY-like chemotaxis protein
MPQPVETPARVTTPHALVVDDEVAVLELMKLILETNGYKVTTAQNGMDALKLYGDRQWSFVLTDRIMPEMGGEQLSAAIRATDSSTPLILMTGEAEESCGAPNFDRVLPKPFTPVQLLEAAKSASRGA